MGGFLEVQDVNVHICHNASDPSRVVLFCYVQCGKAEVSGWPCGVCHLEARWVLGVGF